MNPLPERFSGARLLGPRTWRLTDGRVLREVTGLDAIGVRARLESLRHCASPGLVLPESLEEVQERLFLVRPWVEGRPLEPICKPAEAADLAGMVADLPEDLVLLDLRPEHVLRTEQGLVLCDPGWAEPGTPPYAAPEQHGRGRVTAATGRYQLGATLLHLLCGEPPPDALTLLIPGSEPSLPEGLPSSLGALVLGLLDPDPRDRPAPRQVQQGFQDWLSFRRGAAPARPPDPPPSTRRSAPGSAEHASIQPMVRTRGGPRWATLPVLAGLVALFAMLGLLALTWPALQPRPVPPAQPARAVEVSPRPAGSPLPRSWVHRKDDSRMVLVPAGPFLEGPPPEAGPGIPPQRRELAAFYIDRYEVTNRQFQRFVQATGYKPQGRWRTFATPSRDRHPAIAVSWYDAEAYARWAGKRLPTAPEWEKAARGGDARLYPWGNRWDPERLNCALSPIGSTTEVGSYPTGASPFGCEDMVGNVWEWVDEWYIPLGAGSEHLPLMRVARGGARNDPIEECTALNRVGVLPENGNLVGSGFRCVLDPAP